MAKSKVKNGRDLDEETRIVEAASIQVGSGTFGPLTREAMAARPIPWKPAEPDLTHQPAATPFFFDDVRKAVAGITALRRIRDEKLFQQTGCHSFREWTMKYFGEKLGGWLDDTL